MEEGGMREGRGMREGGKGGSWMEGRREGREEGRDGGNPHRAKHIPIM